MCQSMVLPIVDYSQLLNRPGSMEKFFAQFLFEYLAIFYTWTYVFNRGRMTDERNFAF